jgi:5-methylcytosine-specific restriction endonuclease McrA
MEQTKQCTKCGEVKPVERFSIIRKYSTHRHARCIDCRNAYTYGLQKGIHVPRRRGPAATKICKQCKQEKSYIAFHKSGSKCSPESRRPICKQCLSEQNKKQKPIIPEAMTCILCLQERPVLDFYIRQNVLVRHPPRAEVCKECRQILKTPYTKISHGQRKRILQQLEAHPEIQEQLQQKEEKKPRTPVIKRPRLSTCRRCKQRFPRDQFFVCTKNNKICLACHNSKQIFTPEEKRQKRLTVRRKAQRTYRLKHAETEKQSQKEWRDNNPDKMREYRHRRKTMKHNPQFVERVYIKILRERDKELCGICLRSVSTKQESIDHVVPLSEGGEHSYRNCVLAHKTCNSRKGNRHNIPQQQRLFG